jgi:hypothetical protein
MKPKLTRTERTGSQVLQRASGEKEATMSVKVKDVMYSRFRKARLVAADAHCDSQQFFNGFDEGGSQGSPEPAVASTKEGDKSVPRASFFKLARQHRFAEILEILRRKNVYDLDIWLFHNLHSFRGESPLHMIMHYHPTPTVVDKLIEYLSSSKTSHAVPEEAIDMQGFTPLHVGACKGCSASVMRRLITGVSVVMPAITKDSMGRHALHWACANPRGKASTALCTPFRQRRSLNTDGFSPVDNMVQVVVLLVKAYPEASTIPDMENNTPLDLARANGADPRIITLMEAAFQSCKQECTARSTGSTPKQSDTASEKEFPVEVSEHDFDDISSMGSAGVSRCGVKRVEKPWSVQVRKIEEDFELSSF